MASDTVAIAEGYVAINALRVKLEAITALDYDAEAARCECHDGYREARLLNVRALRPNV